MWKKVTEKKDDLGYWQIEFPPDLKDALYDLVEGRKVPARAIERIKTRLLFARHFSAPLAHLEWAEVEAAAREQGISLADALFDRMGRKEKS